MLHTEQESSFRKQWREAYASSSIKKRKSTMIVGRQVNLDLMMLPVNVSRSMASPLKCLQSAMVM